MLHVESRMQTAERGFIHVNASDSGSDHHGGGFHFQQRTTKHIEKLYCCFGHGWEPAGFETFAKEEQRRHMCHTYLVFGEKSRQNMERSLSCFRKV
jgi:hypothetical protein